MPLPTFPLAFGERSAFFVDRDGVLIEDRVEFARTFDDVEIFPRSIEAIKLVNARGLPVVMVTNQSLIGRGLMSYDEVWALNQAIIAEYRRHGAVIDHAYMCPHSPEQPCDCRKPKPGMLLQAAADHGYDLGASVLVGDALRDLLAASSAGVTALLVQTGQGPQHQAKLTDEQKETWPVVADLLSAVQLILGVPT